MSKKKKFAIRKPTRSIWMGLAVTPILVVFAALLAASLGGSASATAAKPAAANKEALATVTHVSNQTNAEVQKYWTKARMASAVPMVAAVKDTGAQPVGGGPTGAPGKIESFIPAGVASLVPQVAQSPSAERAQAQPQSMPYHVVPPFTRFGVYWKYRTFPLSTVGKLFFTQQGTNYVCSGSTEGNDAYWTAGHCLHAGNNDPSGWSSNMLFCPSYINGVNPAVGCWSWDSAIVNFTWYQTGTGNYDFGGVNAANCGTINCQTIGSFTGWLGLAWNWPREQNWWTVGYPQGAPFNGNAMIACNSQYSYNDDWGAAPSSVSTGCDQTGGTSGGPWIWQFGSGNYINGHQDWYHIGITELNSPYYDCRVLEIHNFINGQNITC